MKRIAAVAAMFMAAMVGAARADTLWTAGPGDWFNPSNWSSGVPSSSNPAKINNGGVASITAAGAQGEVSLGSGAQDSGGLFVSGSGRLSGPGSLNVGVAGAGRLDIDTGGQVSSGRFVMSDLAGSDGTANVSGAGSVWANNVVCFVGFLGTARLSILDGGRVSASTTSVGESSGSNGAVTVSGVGSLWTHPGTVTVGGDGTGTLTVTNGGKVFTGGSGGGFGSVIGRNPSGNGLVTITGAGSAWNNNGSFSVGSGSAGTLHILAGGAVTSSAAIIGGFGGTGSVLVDGAGSSWTIQQLLTVPNNFGGAGTVKIAFGGRLQSANGQIGLRSSVGVVDVVGQGAEWVNGGTINVGYGEISAGSLGILRLRDGGAVSTAITDVRIAGALEIGRSPNLSGALQFSGGALRPITSTAFSKDATIAAQGVTVDSNGFNCTWSGALTGAGGLTKAGAGVLALSNANTYAGSTTVSAGRLFATNVAGSATGGGAVIVNGPTGVLGGTGSVSGTVTVNNGGVVLAGDAEEPAGTLTIANNLTLHPGSTIQLVLGGSGSHSTLHRAGGDWTFAVDQTFGVLNAGAQPGVYSNIITGLAADPGVSSWHLSGSGFSGSFVYDGAGNVSLHLTAVPSPLAIVQAGSRKAHGAAGEFVVDLPVVGRGVECRSGGTAGSHSLLFTFSGNVVSGTATVALGEGAVSGAPTFSGNTMTVNLTGVSDAQSISVTLSSITDSSSQIMTDTTIRAAFLLGDTTGSGMVNASDVGQVKSTSGRPVDGANFRTDVNVSGTINASDIGLVKSKAGAALPPMSEHPDVLTRQGGL